jgi:hypothetical protein
MQIFMGGGRGRSYWTPLRASAKAAALVHHLSGRMVRAGELAREVFVVALRVAQPEP